MAFWLLTIESPALSPDGILVEVKLEMAESRNAGEFGLIVTP